MTDTSVRDFCCKVFRYKERTLAVVFFILEAISLALDQCGGSRLGFLAASFLLSLIVFLIMAYNFTKSRSEVRNELSVIELVFSIVQLIVTYFYLVFAILGVKLKLKASIFPLVLAITALVLAFKSNEQQGTDSSATQIQLIASNTSTVDVEAGNTNSLASSMQDVSSNTPMVVDEEETTDSRALLLHVASSNAPAESTPRSPFVVGNNESTDLREPLISSNSPVMSDEETTSPTMSDDEEIITTPRGWYDVDEGTGWSTDVDEGTVSTEFDEGTWRIDIEECFDYFDYIINYSRPHMRSAHSNLWQSTKLFSKFITVTDIEKELIVPTRAMKHFSIPEGKDFVDLLVKDLKGKFWKFRLTIHPTTALTDGWLAFVQAKDLEPGNIVTFYKQPDENFTEQYRVEVDSEYKW